MKGDTWNSVSGQCPMRLKEHPITQSRENRWRAEGWVWCLRLTLQQPDLGTSGEDTTPLGFPHGEIQIPE